MPKETGIGADDVIVFTGVEYKPRKRIDNIETPERYEGRRIQEAIERLGRATVRQLCQETGYSVGRIVEHVEHSMKLKKPKAVVEWKP